MFIKALMTRRLFFYTTWLIWSGQGVNGLELGLD